MKRLNAPWYRATTEYVSSLCHLGFLVRRTAELLPSRWATGQRTPATKKKNTNYVMLSADWNNNSSLGSDDANVRPQAFI